MTSEEMDKIRKERRTLARELNISGKAGKIAIRLGTKHPKNHGAWYRYSDEDGLKINYDDYGYNLDIMWKETTVFNLHLGNIDGFRPDIPDWVDYLAKIYEEKIAPTIVAEEKQKNRSDEEKFKEKWG